MKKIIVIAISIIVIFGCGKREETFAYHIDRKPHICQCDSLFGYKECDSLNIGSVLFYGDSLYKGSNTFSIERTPLTRTPYQIILNSSYGHGTSKVIASLEKNVRNFSRVPKLGEPGHYYYDIDKRLKSLLPSVGYYDVYMGTKDNKEYFLVAKKDRYDGGCYTHTEIFITDLKLLQLQEHEQYEKERPQREKKEQEKIKKEKEAQIFPF